MLIDPNNLCKISTFASKKDLSIQHVYRLIESGELNSIKIDGVQFVILDEKAKEYQRKRVKK